MTRDEIIAQGYQLFPRAVYEALRARPEKMRVFQAVLHAAAFKAQTFNGVNIPYGGSLMSLRRLANETMGEKNQQLDPIPETTLRRCRDELAAEGYIAVLKTRLGTLIVVQNFDLFDNVKAYTGTLAPPTLAPLNEDATGSGEKTYEDDSPDLGTPWHPLGTPLAPPTLAPLTGETLAPNEESVTVGNRETYGGNPSHLGTPDGGDLGTPAPSPAKVDLGTHPLTSPCIQSHLDGETDRPARPEGDAGSSEAAPPEHVYLNSLERVDFEHMKGWRVHEIERVEVVAALFGRMYLHRFERPHHPIKREAWELATSKLRATLMSGVAEFVEWEDVIEQYLSEWNGESPTTGERRNPNFEAFCGPRMITNLINHMSEGR